MPEKYKLELFTNGCEVGNTMFTSRKEIVIGSSLRSDIRLQKPSIEEKHAQVYFDGSKRIKIFGDHVFLNEEVLENGSTRAFEFGDVIRIDKYKFVFSLSEPGDHIEEDWIIRRPTMELQDLDEEKCGSSVESKVEVTASTSSVEDAEQPIVHEENIISVALNKATGVKVSASLIENRELGHSAMKQVISEQKGILEDEIRDLIENPIRDTPIIRSIWKNSTKDLGEAVIEKEILEMAEKVIDEKIKQSNNGTGGEVGDFDLMRNVKDDTNNELRDDLKQGLASNTKDEVENEIKGVFATPAGSTIVCGIQDTDKMEDDEEMRVSETFCMSEEGSTRRGSKKEVSPGPLNKREGKEKGVKRSSESKVDTPKAKRIALSKDSVEKEMKTSSTTAQRRQTSTRRSTAMKK